jgi:RNA polymerase sigma-70 factor (ECF subfamily)
VSRSERDDELVSRYLGGDTEALSSLLRRHESRVYRVCLRILGSPDDAADATQDAFVSVVRRIDQFRGDAAFTTWLHRIAVNACYDQLRVRRRQATLQLAHDPNEPQPDLGPPTPDHADQVIGTRDAAAALARIPEEFRVAVVLADVEDLPYEEVARILEVPIGTVKSRVHRGRVALARAMRVPPRGEREPSSPSRPSEEEA